MRSLQGFSHCTGDMLHDDLLQGDPSPDGCDAFSRGIPRDR